MKKTTTKQSLTKAKILKGIKMTVNTNTVLPILEDVYLADDFVHATDLESYVSIPFKTGLKDTCVNAGSFISAIEIIQEPSFEIKDSQIQISERNGSKKIKLATDDPNNFVVAPIKSVEQYNEIGYFSENDLTYFTNALKFTSNDDLRPAMTGIYVGNEIAATDAHRLYWHSIEPLICEMIMPQKTVKLMLHFGGNWQVFGGKIQKKSENKSDEKSEAKKVKEQYTHAALLNEDGVLIEFRTIDARFPDYKVAIPQGQPNVTLISDTSMWRKELKNALKFCNRSTEMCIIELNGTVSLNAFDIDFSTEYTKEFTKTEAEAKGKLRIAFNMSLLDDVLSALPKDEPLKINMWDERKAVIINDNYLLMPLMLNQ